MERSAAASARGETAVVARPGGVMSAFCEPPTTTSIPQASVSSGTAARLEMASTTESAPASAAAAAIAWASLTTPVEVSLCVKKTAWAPPTSASRAAISSGFGVSPHS